MGRLTNKESTESKPSAKAGDIGKTGNTQGEKSDEGGQYVFLPRDYSGTKDRDVTPGETHEGEIAQYNFLPGSPADALKSGGKR